MSVLTEKVAFAKMLGLESDVVPDSEIFHDNVEQYDLPTDAYFQIGDKYFTVESETLEGAWEAAAEKVIGDLTRLATAHYQNFSYYRR